MRVLLLTVILTLASCSSTPLELQMKRQELINEHLSQGKRYIKGDFAPRFSTSGNDGIHVRAVGISVYPAGANEALTKSASVSDGKFKLIESAPSEFKSMVQRAIGNSLGHTGEYNKIETSVSEVHALEGIESGANDTQCKIVVEPTVELTYRTSKECRSIVKVSVVNLRKAYDFTIERKYGLKKRSVVQDILNQQLNNSVNGNREVSSVPKGRGKVHSVQQRQPRANNRQKEPSTVSRVQQQVQGN